MTLLSVAPPVIVDSSVAVALITGELDAPSTLIGWSSEGRVLLAPPLLFIEAANALIRGKQLSATDVARLLEDLREARIDVADRGSFGLNAAVVLAERHRLTVYDATYLWLAIDVDGELATFDRELMRAARAEGVDLAITS